MEKLKNKKTIIVGVIILIVIIAGIITIPLIMNGNKKEQDKTSTNEPQTSTRKSEAIENFEFSLENEKFENNASDFTVKIANTAAEAKYLNQIYLQVNDPEGNELVKLYGVVDQEIPGQDSILIGLSYGGDLSNHGEITFHIEQ